MNPTEGRYGPGVIGNLSATHRLSVGRLHRLSGYLKRGGVEHLVNCAWWLDAEFDILSWFARAPSQSNIADGPSRCDFNMCLSLGCKQITPRAKCLPFADEVYRLLEQNGLISPLEKRIIDTITIHRVRFNHYTICYYTCTTL